MLRALQTERDSVHELENALSTLQQNNSAISEMVESRDMLIDELNNRVAVFEEDKVVLKAALRQLQKEMKDEGPKTQKVIDDLKDAREEIERLNFEINSILSEHQTELSLLQNIISQKQAALDSSESNMTVIGSYVDKLEERLATFALARRDIDLREQKCKEIEERAILLEKERDELRAQVGGYDSEHDDLKFLLADLVNERTQLQNKNAALVKERDGLFAGGRTLRDTIASLEIDIESLGKYVSDWKSRVSVLESTIENQSSELRQREEREEELATALGQKATELEEKAVELEQQKTAELQRVLERKRFDLEREKAAELERVLEEERVDLEQQKAAELERVLEEERVDLERQKAAELERVLEEERIDLEQQKAAELERMLEQERVDLEQQKAAELERLLEQERVDLEQQKAAELERLLEQERVENEGVLSEEPFFDAEPDHDNERDEIMLLEEDAQPYVPSEQYSGAKPDIPPPPPPPPPMHSESLAGFNSVDEDFSLESNEDVTPPSFASMDDRLLSGSYYEQGPPEPVSEWSPPENEAPEDAEPTFESSSEQNLPEQPSDAWRWDEQRLPDLPVDSVPVEDSPTNLEPADEDDHQPFDEVQDSHGAPDNSLDEPDLSDPDLQSSAADPELPDSATESNENKNNNTELKSTAAPQVLKGPPIPGKFQKPRDEVPFRMIRKAFARTTGIHGVISPSSQPDPTRPKNGK